MPAPDPVEYVCVQCGFRVSADDTLVSTCPRCGAEMRNVRPVAE